MLLDAAYALVHHLVQALGLLAPALQAQEIALQNPGDVPELLADLFHERFQRLLVRADALDDVANLTDDPGQDRVPVAGTVSQQRLSHCVQGSETGLHHGDFVDEGQEHCFHVARQRGRLLAGCAQLRF